MPDQWYYEHEMKKCGPVSPRQLRDLADTGVIRPTDTIWKEGIERGVSAAKVKNLFPATPAAAVETVPAPAPASPPLAESADAEPALAAAQGTTALAEPAVPAEVASEPAAPPAEAATAEKEKPPARPKQPVKKARATPIRGLVITAQDGSHVQFRKKCVVCGHEDPNKMRIPIKNGITRINFFCSKCKKMRQAEFQGVL